MKCDVKGYRIRVDLGKVDADSGKYIPVEDNIIDIHSIGEEVKQYRQDLRNDSLTLRFFLIDQNITSGDVFLAEIEAAEQIEYTEDTYKQVEDTLLEAIMSIVRTAVGIPDGKYSQEEIKITKLFDKYDVTVDLSNPVNILIGANGVGKTSIIRLIDYYCNSNFVDIIGVPFKRIGYKFLGDIRDGSNLDFAICNGYEVDKFLPCTQALIEAYCKEIEQQGGVDFSTGMGYLPLEKAKEKYNELLDMLVQRGLYRQFIYDWYKKENWNRKISELVDKYALESVIRKSGAVEAVQKKYWLGQEYLRFSGVAAEVEQTGTREDIHSLEWYTIYVDFVNNVRINNNRITVSSWNSEDIEWAIDHREASYELGSTRWWHPELKVVENYQNGYYYAKTLVELSRPRVNSKVRENESLYKEYALNSFTLDSLNNSLIPQHCLSQNISGVIDLSVISKLKSEAILDVNLLLYEQYCTSDQVIEINNWARGYADIYLKKHKNVPEKEAFYLLKEYVEAKQQFVALKGSYETYIRPLLINHSFFAIDSDMLMSVKYVDIFEEAYYELIQLSEDERQEYYKKDEWSCSLNPMIWNDTVYLQELCEYIKCIMNNMAFGKMKTEKTCKFENVLKKYFETTNVEVTPSGLVLSSSNDEIDLSVLSSGERKIITLFALDIFYDKLLLLLDEPELSLSIVWQEMLLPDLIENGNNKLIVATHSPYIANSEKIQEYITYLPQAD